MRKEGRGKEEEWSAIEGKMDIGRLKLKYSGGIDKIRKK